MQIKTQVRTNFDGSLDLHLLTELSNSMVDVIIFVEPSSEIQSSITIADEWPQGFLERYYGCLANDPLEEPEDLPPEPIEVWD